MLFNLNNPYDVQKFDEHIKKLRDQKAVVDVKKKHPNRSLAQNSYLHVILGYFACTYGCSIEYAKTEYFKKECNKDLFIVERTTKNGEVIQDWRSSSDLDTAEMTIAIDRFRNWSASIGGIYLPSPNEGEALIYAQQIIYNNQEYI